MPHLKDIWDDEWPVVGRPEVAQNKVGVAQSLSHKGDWNGQEETIFFPRDRFNFVLLLYACSTKETSVTIDQERETGANNAQPRYGGELKIIFQEPTRNIGFPAEDAAGITLYYNLPALETLTRYNEKGEVTPWLAKEWDLDPENKTITFYLNEGIKSFMMARILMQKLLNGISNSIWIITTGSDRD